MWRKNLNGDAECSMKELRPTFNHSSMQAEWNICRQLLGRATMSVGRIPSLHMAHCGKNLLM